MYWYIYLSSYLLIYLFIYCIVHTHLLSLIIQQLSIKSSLPFITALSIIVAHVDHVIHVVRCAAASSAFFRSALARALIDSEILSRIRAVLAARIREYWSFN